MDWKQISGATYDWTVTGGPEHPYVYDYSQTMTMKMFLAAKRPEGGTDVRIDLEEALERIKAVDAITLGTPKIIYLVGWQYDGHDSKYPAWHECNPALKRPCDATARDSILWLCEEAKKYHTTVSFHVNMMDAYKNSPLWEEYLAKDLLCTNCKGEPLLGGVWDGEQAYLMCYKKEWDSGYAVKRIQELCELLPIREAGTIHIDAMMNPCLRGGCCKYNTGENMGDPSLEARHKIIRYFRSLGVDVTTEHCTVEPEVIEGKDYLVGMLPMTYHFSQRPEDYIRRPATLICGGNAHSRRRGPEAKRMKDVFGENIIGENLFAQQDYKKQFFREFCLTYLPFTFLNSKKRERLERYGEDEFRAYFSDGVITDTDGPSIRQGEQLLRHGNQIMLPALWQTQDNLILYSADEGEYTWQVGQYLGKTIKVRRLTENGLDKEEQIINLTGDCVTLHHQPDVAYFCTT